MRVCRVVAFAGLLVASAAWCARAQSGPGDKETLKRADAVIDNHCANYWTERSAYDAENRRKLRRPLGFDRSPKRNDGNQDTHN